MRNLFLSPKLITITLAVLAIIIIPITVIEVQNQQNLKQNAESILWITNQSASTACAPDGSGANIEVTFTNAEPPSTSTSMNVTAKDAQTGKTVNMGAIKGGSSKTSAIVTSKTTLDAGTVTFALSWTDGHAGTDSRTASYKAVSKCISTPTPTPKPIVTPSPTPTTPPDQPTPTICPTLEPVKNVNIVCPNCQLKDNNK
ncbi:MAG TPA: hypothetical protein VLF93_03380 [Candidatus Saccharimonadales bacterium]|nr:hypothetical protein [Candidatus Saccharimonadales bacterium]